jgi:hypothetical protein
VLTIKTQCNLRNAEKYFEEHLQLGDYYSQENQVFGEWVGTGAELLGLAGVVKEADFLKLCRNERDRFCSHSLPDGRRIRPADCYPISLCSFHLLPVVFPTLQSTVAPMVCRKHKSCFATIIAHGLHGIPQLSNKLIDLMSGVQVEVVTTRVRPFIGFTEIHRCQARTLFSDIVIPGKDRRWLAAIFVRALAGC